MFDSVTPMDCIPPGSSVQGTLLARILERVTMPFSDPGIESTSSLMSPPLVGRLFTTSTTCEAHREGYCLFDFCIVWILDERAFAMALYSLFYLSAIKRNHLIAKDNQPEKVTPCFCSQTQALAHLFHKAYPSPQPHPSFVLA